MTKPTLTFQPEADRYYAEGHWRDGRPLGRLRPRVRRAPGQGGADPRRPRGHLRGAQARGDRRVEPARGRRRPARRGRDPARPPLDRGRGRDARVPAPRRRARAAAADVQRDAAFGPARADAGQGARLLRRREGDREVQEVADEVPFLLAILPELVDELAASDLPADREPRDADDLAMILHSSGHHVGPEGDLALEQHPALRHRGRVPPLGADRRGRLSRRVRVRLRRRTGLRLLPAAAQRRHRRPREPLERR